METLLLIGLSSDPFVIEGGFAAAAVALQRAFIANRIGALKDRDEVVGNHTRVKVVKNKIAPPFKQAEFDIMYGEGISKTGEILDMGVDKGIVEKAGSWFSYNGERLGQGRENAKRFLTENPDAADEIEYKIRVSAGLIKGDIADEPDVSADIAG